METIAPLHADAAAVVVGGIAQQGRHGELVVGVLHPGLDAVPVTGIPVEGQVRDNLFPGTQIETEAGVAPVRVEGLLVETPRGQRVGVRGQGVEVGEVAVVEVEIVDALLARIQVGSAVGIAAPSIGARIQAVEEALLGVLNGKIQAGQLGTLSQVDHAAVSLEIAGVGDPAVPEIEAAGKPTFGRRRRQRRFDLLFGFHGSRGGLGVGLGGLFGRLLRQGRNYQDEGQQVSHLRKSRLT